MSTCAGRNLKDTLELALAQCQDQTRLIQRLLEENARLQRELEHTKAEAKGRSTEEKEDASSMEELFQRYVEAQAEITSLKRKLRAYKEKANSRLPAPISSPLSLPATPSPTFLKQPITEKDGCRAHGTKDEASPPRSRKRQKTEERSALHELATNTTQSRISSAGVPAWSLHAGDREDCMSIESGPEQNKSELGREKSKSRRPHGLLSASTPGRAPLDRSRSSKLSTEQPKLRTDDEAASRISNIIHITDSIPSMSPPRAGNRSTPDGIATTSLGSHGKVDVRSKEAKTSPEDHEPFRARPLSRLSLQHFKQNPRWLDTLGMSYDDFLHGQGDERIKALAETLPQTPWQHEKPMTDDELLLEFLGPGSDERVTTLTSVARRNLLEEARLKYVVKSFRRQSSDYCRDQDPPGFWSTDFPGTQEEKENREKAWQMKRNEVKRRYDDAMSGHRRWVFADE